MQEKYSIPFHPSFSNEEMIGGMDWGMDSGLLFYSISNIFKSKEMTYGR
jgi:hypothetical protein